MSRNPAAGRAKLTDAERAVVDAIASDGSRESLDRAFHEQLKIARGKIAKTRKDRRERGRQR